MSEETKAPFRKVVRTGRANFWRGRVTGYSQTELECGHLVLASPGKKGCVHRTRCFACLKAAPTPTGSEDR